MSSCALEETKDTTKPDKHINSTKPNIMETKNKQEDEEDKEEKKSKETALQPGQARKVKLYLIDPHRFVIEWRTPKKLGKPLPLHFTIIINNNLFKHIVTQNNKKQMQFRVLVFNCDCNELYKVAVETYNKILQGKQTILYNIKTIIKPSVTTDLQMISGIITFKPPIYKSFGNIKYELIDANDVEEKTILTIDEKHPDDDLLFDIDGYYTDENTDTLEEYQWRIRVKETTYGNCSFSPIIGYNVGTVKCVKFTAAKMFAGDLNKFKIKPIKYPKWEAPPTPDILKEINKIELIDKGTYLLVPSKLNPIKNDSVLTVMCFSDTHTKHKSFRFDRLPPADLLLHAGDFTFDGNKSEVMGFEQWGKFLASLSVDEEKNKEIYSYENYYNANSYEYYDEKKQEKYILPMEQRKYKHLICIAGNHDMTFDLQWYNEQGSNAKRYHKSIKPELNASEIKDIIISSDYWTYLQDTYITLYGLKIYGSPWQPCFYNWAFQKNRGEELNEKWKLIPSDTDIVITHGPPYCHGDKIALERVKSNDDNLEYVGDKMLMKRIKEIKHIKYHVFGHIHGYGCSMQNGINTVFINASSVDGYEPRDKPIVFYVENRQLAK